MPSRLSSSSAFDPDGGDEQRALGRIYSLARRSVLERIEVDAKTEQKLAVIVLFAFCAERRASGSRDDEVAIARECAAWLLAKTSAATGVGVQGAPRLA